MHGRRVCEHEDYKQKVGRVLCFTGDPHSQSHRSTSAAAQAHTRVYRSSRTLAQLIKQPWITTAKDE